MADSEFGPLATAEPVVNDENGTAHNMTIEKVLLEKQEMADEFGKQRAKLMDMFKIKEDAQFKLEGEKEALRVELESMKSELNNLKAVAKILEDGTSDEMKEYQRKCREEVASMQHIMKEAVSQAHQEAVNRIESEREVWMQSREKLEIENQELRNKLSSEREGFLANVAKTLQKKVVGQAGPNSEAENLEASMRKAQEDADMLRSVIMPLEEEIAMLKSKLRLAYDKIDSFTDKDGSTASESGRDFLKSAGVEPESQDKMKELNEHLATEKASRTDLEMYVAVLNTQKNVLQEENDKQHAQFKEVCRLLEQEKREHSDLKQTWEMANDQFLQSQRLMMMDLRRMEDVLSSEQQRQITELKKADAEREAQEKRVRELEEARKHEEERQAQDAEKRTLVPNQASEFSQVLGANSPSSSQPAFLSTSANTKSSVSGNSSPFEIMEENDIDLLRMSPEKQINIPALTEEMQKAITDPTPETELSQNLLDNVKAMTIESKSLPGRRVVSENEWTAMQAEVKSAREKLGQPCDMCRNYESQLQSVQENHKKSMSQLRGLERSLEAERQANTNLNTYKEELEIALKTKMESASSDITTLVSKQLESEKYIRSMKAQFASSQNELQDQLKLLTEGREEIQKELTRLQEENDSLIGKHSKHSQELQDENIDMPNTIEDLHHLLLLTREELIQSKVAREHIEETKKSEIMFLKDQAKAELQERGTMEETLNNEIHNLQTQLALLQSAKSEMERQTQLRQETEAKLKESENQFKTLQAKSKQLISALQSQLEEQTQKRNQFEEEASKQKSKVLSLQSDLENSEAVQRDFVKLSQSLQIQFEKIRAAETEVRWQHEEDVDDCSNCKQAFSVTKRKHHCRHCGKIFCADCLTKTVHGGPNLRPSKVCDVCHTILVKDATPYFSTEPPATPD